MRPTLLATLLIIFAAPFARAELRTEEITYEHDGVQLRGYLAFDDSHDGKLPGVLVVHEWRGHDAYARSRAEELAALGYIAFALDMYGDGVLAKNNEEAGKLASRFYNDRDLARSRATAGLDVLRNHERCDADRTAAIGYCFGGTMVLELARAGVDLAAVVSFHGGLATSKPAEKDAVKATVLVCNGYDDPLVSMEDRLAFKEEMASAEADWLFIDYAGAVHGFTNPKNGSGTGPVAYHPQAAARAWQHMLDIFQRRLAAR